MKISDILASKQTFSFEIFPPRGDLSLQQAAQISAQLAECRPDWISVTFSAGGSGNSGNTVAISADIQDKLGVNALSHLTCMGSSHADIEAHVERMRAAGIQNVLALRGDRAPGRDVIDFAHASDLIPLLKDAGFCVGAACYPEGHVESEDFEASMDRLKAKQDAGADFLVTQLFFDNEYFYRFREACDRHRVKIPVVVGIMPFTSASQLQRMAFTCGASIPSRVIKRLVAVGDDAEAQRRAGIDYACEQLAELSRNGVDGLHVYCMNRPDVARSAHDALLAAGYLAR